MAPKEGCPKYKPLRAYDSLFKFRVCLNLDDLPWTERQPAFRSVTTMQTAQNHLVKGEQFHVCSSTLLQNEPEVKMGLTWRATCALTPESPDSVFDASLGRNLSRRFVEYLLKITACKGNCTGAPGRLDLATLGSKPDAYPA